MSWVRHSGIPRRRSGIEIRLEQPSRSCNLLVMKDPLEDPASRGPENSLGPSQEYEVEGDSPELPELIRQRTQFAHDVTRIEAALARNAEGGPELYESLLRLRRISGKLENRIELVRLQQKIRAGT